MDIHRPNTLVDAYALDFAPVYDLHDVQRVQTGICRIAKGTRSPPEGLKTSAENEIAYVLRGRIRVETATGVFEASAGDILTTCPAQAHGTTALEDCELFFVLLSSGSSHHDRALNLPPAE